jgi:uncharacterized membrane protein HdeD (DUF308 family)
MAEPNGYEFNAEQKATIDRVEMAIKGLGIFLSIYGVLLLIDGADGITAKGWLTGSRISVEGIILMVTSRFLRRAAGSLEKVAKGTGNGIPGLMAGLDGIRRAMRVFGIAMIVLAVLESIYAAVAIATRHFGVQLPGM